MMGSDKVDFGNTAFLNLGGGPRGLRERGPGDMLMVNWSNQATLKFVNYHPTANVIMQLLLERAHGIAAFAFGKNA